MAYLLYLIIYLFIFTLIMYASFVLYITQHGLRYTALVHFPLDFLLFTSMQTFEKVLFLLIQRENREVKL